MALRDYLAEEVAEDWADGLIPRREALRRLALLGLSTSSALVVLAACAPQGPAAAYRDVLDWLARYVRG